MDLGRVYHEGEKKLNKTNIYETKKDGMVKNLEDQVIINIISRSTNLSLKYIIMKMLMTRLILIDS
jgi:hypothetical protein